MDSISPRVNQAPLVNQPVTKVKFFTSRYLFLLFVASIFHVDVGCLFCFHLLYTKKNNKEAFRTRSIFSRDGLVFFVLENNNDHGLISLRLAFSSFDCERVTHGFDLFLFHSRWKHAKEIKVPFEEIKWILLKHRDNYEAENLPGSKESEHYVMKLIDVTACAASD